MSIGVFTVFSDWLGCLNYFVETLWTLKSVAQMPQFITRIELHGAGHNEPIYQTLHDAMEANSFKRTIRGKDGKLYHMLTAEYEITGNYSTETVMTSATAAATLTGKSFSVFVSEVTLSTFFNLRPA